MENWQGKSAQERVGTTITDLPEEILVEIFKLLDFRSLKEATLTCKSWKLFMEQSIQWNMLVPSYSEDMFTKSNNHYSLRRFKNVRTRSVNDFINFLVGRKGRDDVKELDFFTTQFDNADLRIMIKILKDLPNLEKINFSACPEPTANASSFEYTSTLPEFSKLKTLEFHQSDTNFLPIFKKARIHTLIFSRDRVCYSPSTVREVILDFLASQPYLQTLYLDSCTVNVLFLLIEPPIPIENVPFKLKELSLNNFNKFFIMYDNNNVLNFMELHKGSLETLELGILLPESVFEVVLKEFKRLKTLRLIINFLPRGPEFYERLSVNLSVTSLTLCETFFARNASSQIINHLPNIESLAVTSIFHYANTALVAAGSLKRLKKLSIEVIGPGEFSHVDFPELESLEFFCGEDPNRSCELKKFLKNRKLRKLVYDGSVDEDMFPDDFKNLESIDLKRTASGLPDTASIQGLRFREDDFFKS